MSVFVACSTLCFAREPLEKALRLITELEFDKFELAIVEDGQHLRPTRVGDDLEAALQQVRRGPSLTPSSIHLDFGPVDWNDQAVRRRFDAPLPVRQGALCRRSHHALRAAGNAAGTGDQATLRRWWTPPCGSAWCRLS